MFQHHMKKHAVNNVANKTIFKTYLPLSPILKKSPHPFGYFKPILSVITDIRLPAVVDDSTSNDWK